MEIVYNEDELILYLRPLDARFREEHRQEVQLMVKDLKQGDSA